MRGLLVLILLGLAGFFAWRYFAAPRAPRENPAEARQTASQVVRFWVDSIREGKKDRAFDVCSEAGRRQTEGVFEELLREQWQLGAKSYDFKIHPVAAADTFKVTLSSPSGLVTYLRIRAEKAGEEYRIAEARLEGY